MKRMLTSTGLTLLLGLAAPLWGAAGDSQTRGEKAETGVKKPDLLGGYRDMLQATNELWFLLSSIRDKTDADKAARKFVELVSRVNKLDADLGMMNEDEQDTASLEQLRYRIMDAYCNVDSEFGGLCRVRCYGSQELVEAFHSAIAGGMFDADDLPLLQDSAPYSEEEAKVELARLKKLAEPDREVLECLRQVVDPGSAQKSASALERINGKLRALAPGRAPSHRNFPDAAAASVNEASAPLEQLLWGIRTEIVRIAGIPGYDTEPYDTFSDALDDVYETLGATHNGWFDDVFDDSFRIDLDEAYRENNPSTAATAN